MTDQFVNQVMKTSVAALCQSMGWNSAQTSTIDILGDVWKRHFLHLAKSIKKYSEHDGRTEPNFDDAALVLRDMNVSVPELEEYVQNFDPIRLPYNIPNFPVKKESHLNLLRPGSAEVLTRPVHIHEYMPPWGTEDKKEKPAVETNGVLEPVLVITVEDTESETEAAVKSEAPGSPRDMKEVTEENAVVVEDMEVDKEVEIEDSSVKDEPPATPPTSASLPYSPFGQPIKSTKRFESSGENPALKRVRMELEEEGHPLREISSVMMTTSGFLSSNREGRLPDARPPLNRDFFDPEPVVEKKKIPTMKRIVEGIKKLDKEKENQTSGNNAEEMELFGKPDKITVGESKSRESIAQKYKDRSKLSFKVSSSSKKDFKYGDRESKAEKLKIFTKKTLKGYEKYRKDSKKKLKVRPVDLDDEEDDGLDEISSEEDFNESERSKAQEKKELLDKKARKRVKELFILKTKKDKKKEKISPKIVTTSPSVGSSGEPPEKKKRGRPRKVQEAIPTLFGDPFTPIIKMPKMPKKLRQLDDMNKLVPEINIKVNRTLPPPPDLISFMGRLPMQPGLIPASFGPPPPLRLGGGHLPPSISITPATPSTSMTSNPMSSKEQKNSSLPLPSNVCSSVTITRIDMPGSQKLPSQYDNSNTPGIGGQRPSVQISMGGRQSPPPAVLEIQPDVSSGITITPILMMGDQPSSKTGSGLAKLEEDMRTKEQKRKDKEKRRELKKEKKKEKRDKLKEKERVIIFENFDKIEKEKKKDKDREKKKKKESPTVVEGVIPKLTLKLHSSSASTPVDSPGHSQRDKSPVPPPRKITIKPVLEEFAKKRTPSPELARFVPLVTRPSKSTKVTPPKPSPPVPAGDKGSTDGKRGRPPGRGRGRPPKASSSQAALVTETVGFYIDEHGVKVWICPSCSRQDDGSPMIGCDTCDDWHHFSCVGITETPDEKMSWFCQRCRLKKKTKSVDTNSNFDYKRKVPRM